MKDKTNNHEGDKTNWKQHSIYDKVQATGTMFRDNGDIFVKKIWKLQFLLYIGMLYTVRSEI